MRHYGLFWGELGADLVGVKCCSHTLLLHTWVSVRRARSHPEPHRFGGWAQAYRTLSHSLTFSHS